MLAKSGHLAVVAKDPIAKLEGMGVDRRHRPHRRLAKVGEHRLRGHDARHPLKEAIRHRRVDAFDHMGISLHVIGHAPSIGMALTLVHQCIVGTDQAAMNLTGNHGTKPKETAHGRSTLVEISGITAAIPILNHTSSVGIPSPHRQGPSTTSGVVSRANRRTLRSFLRFDLVRRNKTRPAVAYH